jgi:NAD+ synthase (glutamine-hydrolysing)
MAVGYGTLYGDLSGGLSVLGDVYKTNVYKLAKWINQQQNVIPHQIFTKAPSAELRENQKDTDTLPPYEILDNILIRYLEEFKSVHEIHKETKYSIELINQVIQMVNKNIYKRYQTAPVLRITKKAFGPGRQMPIVAKY